jgi:hypothetical protein
MRASLGWVGLLPAIASNTWVRADRIAALELEPEVARVLLDPPIRPDGGSDGPPSAFPQTLGAPAQWSHGHGTWVAGIADGGGTASMARVAAHHALNIHRVNRQFVPSVAEGHATNVLTQSWPWFNPDQVEWPLIHSAVRPPTAAMGSRAGERCSKESRT